MTEKALLFNPDQISKARSEPLWLEEARKGAYEVFRAVPWPSKKTEAWRYSAGRLKAVPFDLPLEEPRGQSYGREALPEWVQSRISSADFSAFLVFKGADLVYAEVPEELTEKGLRFLSLHQALKAYPELVEAHLYKAIPARQKGDANDKLPALNAAIWNHGVFVYVPDGLQLEAPIGVLREIEAGVLSVGRTLVVLGENARLSYVEEHYSPDLERPSVNLAMTELILGAGASLVHANVQSWGDNVHHLYRQRALLARDASLKDLTVNLGASFARSEVGSELAGPGADSEMLGIYFADGDQHLDHYTLQHHVAPHARSDVYYKGVAKDRGNIIYQGLIQLEPAAQKTDAYQTNRNLLLSREARAESVPQLEIAANDVRCSHGSSIAPIDSEQRFYLQSRGISRLAAENLLVAAFLEDVLGRIRLENLARYLAGAIEQKVGLEV